MRNSLPRPKPRAAGWQKPGVMLLLLQLTFPNFLLLGVFVFWPIFYSLYLSFQMGHDSSKKRFVGFDNFRLMFADPVFWLVTKTPLFLRSLLLVKLGIALALALMMNRNMREDSISGCYFQPDIYHKCCCCNGLVMDPRTRLRTSAGFHATFRDSAH